MYFERYLLRTRDNESRDVFDSRFINDTLYSEKTISGEILDIYNEAPLHYELNYASFQNIVATYTKPKLLANIGNLKLFGFKIIYAKTSDNQAIVSVSSWDQVEELTSSEGPAYTLNIFCVLYENMIKFALEYQYHALPNLIIYKLFRNIVQDCFLNIDIYDSVYNNDDFELCMDFSVADYKNIFNSSSRSKQLILHMDANTDGGEIINRSKLVHTIKSDSRFENVLAFARTKISGNGIARYVIKCEDSDGRIATLENTSSSNSWEQPARTEIDINSNFYKRELYTFLRK